MSSSHPNTMYADNPQGDGAQAPAPRANDRPRAKIPANDEAAAETAANDEVDVENPPPDLVPDGDGAGGRGGGGGGGGGATQAWINITVPGIAYTDKEVGFMTMGDGGPALGSDGGTVLRLLFYLTYTSEGRTLLLNNAVENDATRATLKGALEKKFPALQSDRLQIAIDAHFAAGAYVAALENNEPDKMGQMQEIYRQRLLAILGALYDDAMGRDFSCVW
jgi:hypothetical protein